MSDEGVVTMNEEAKIRWLRRVLIVKSLLTIFVWGLPALLGPQPVLEFFRVPVPHDPVYLRLFGGAATAWGIAYWLASRDPARNVAILKAGVVDNALPTIAVIVIGLTSGVSSGFIWLSAALTALFFLLFLVLMPRERQATGA
jgi:hypothetical protein